MDSLTLALDFGGTKLSAAVTADSETWLAHERFFSQPEATAVDDYRQMIALAHKLLNGRQPQAVGVSFGGPVDFERGLVRLSHHVPGWEEMPLRERLTAEFDAPVWVDNDANVAALGEWRYGAGQGVDDLLYVTVSTGVGGGWVLNGRIWRGHEGMAGEIGHTVVDPHGPLCLCGKQGCVERLASGPYMAQDLAAAWESEERPFSGDVTGQVVAEKAAAGDPSARRILLRGANALGLGLGNAANLINPARIILGGGVTKAGDLWWQELRRTVRATCLPEVSISLHPAQLGDDAPLWGAVALASETIGHR
ncbi:MAG: ROK family protein [Chloroflexota bacterium]